MALALIVLVLTACSSGRFTIEPTPTVGESMSAKEISTGVAGAYVKKRLKITAPGARDAYVMLFLAGDAGSTTTARPTVVMTAPYEGIDWSEKAVDLKWSAKPAALTGYVANDDDSIGYPGGGGRRDPLQPEE